MPQDTHTEVTKRSWGSRLGGSLKGILLGLILIGLAFWLLTWNEGRAVRRARALTEGGGIVVSVPADRVDAANEGKLVHLSGLATTSGELRDETFGVTVNAIHLERSVEMFQWRENSDSTTEKKLGGGTETTTTYSYDKAWSSSIIDSGQFKKPEGHQNPGYVPYKTWETSASEVSVGPFRLSEGLVGSMRRSESLPVESVAGLPSDLRWKSHPYNGGIYIGGSPSTPAVGDVRVFFQVVRPATVSIVARQTGDRLQPYRTSKGGNIELLSYGTVAADAMFESAQQARHTMTWILRVVGFLLMAFGLKTTLRPFSVMADVVPAFGRMVEAVSGFAAYFLAAALSLITVALAWLYYRPALAVTLLLLAGAGLALAVVAFFKILKKPKVAPASP